MDLNLFSLNRRPKKMNALLRFFQSSSTSDSGIYFYLNNCRNLDHLALYGGNAFYDLWAKGRDDEFARELQPGDTCLVASYYGAQKHDKGKVAFARFRFTGRRKVPSAEAPGAIWVLDGVLEQREILPKSEAAKHPLYSRFFDKRGHFKQASVLRGS
jgi:hypothetical protein